MTTLGESVLKAENEEEMVARWGLQKEGWYSKKKSRGEARKFEMKTAGE